jgi:methylmalonyl-CoA mutase N-terminal domain/subunit
LGGSYFVEWATNKIEKGIIEFLDILNHHGGIASDRGSKWLRAELEKSAYEYQQRIRNGDLVKVGVNAFTIQGEKEVMPIIHRNPPGTETVQLERLREVKATRNGENVKRHLAKLREVAERKKNMNFMPFIIQAVKDYASIGEILGEIREGYGYSYDPSSEVGTFF